MNNRRERVSSRAPARLRRAIDVPARVLLVPHMPPRLEYAQQRADGGGGRGGRPRRAPLRGPPTPLRLGYAQPRGWGGVGGGVRHRSPPLGAGGAPQPIQNVHDLTL